MSRVSPFGTVAHVGPMTRCVQDAALMLNVLALPDARDWMALPYDLREKLIPEAVRAAKEKAVLAAKPDYTSTRCGSLSGAFFRSVSAQAYA